MEKEKIECCSENHGELLQGMVQEPFHGTSGRALRDMGGGGIQGFDR